MREFYGGCFKMWLKWNKPASPFIASISLIAMIGGLFAWLYAKGMGLPDISQSILFVIFLLGLSCSVFILFALAPYKMWKDAAPHVVKAQMQNEKQFVFPYIRTVNASPVIDADERYLTLSLYLPTSLVQEIEINPIVRLVLNGANSEEIQIGKVKLTWQYVSRLTELHIPLTEQILSIVRQSVRDTSPVRITLKIRTENEKLYWETEELTTLMLTRVN